MNFPPTSRARRRALELAPRLFLLVAGVVILVFIGTRYGGDDVSRGFPSSPADEFDPESPNVVVVMTDDQALDTMRAMPHTKRLIGRRGVKFTNSFVSNPLCCPSRATFLTGQYAHNHGVLSNSGAKGGYKRLDSERTLPVWLLRAGYRTAFVGKYLNGYGKDEGVLEVPPGWSDWYATPGKGKQRAFDFELNENGVLVSNRGRTGSYKTRVFSDKAKAFIHEHAPKQRPFFLWVAATAPHADGSLPGDADRNPEPAPDDRGRFEGLRAPRGPAFDQRGKKKVPFVKNLPELDRERRRRLDRLYVSQLESLVAVDRLVRQLVRELRRKDELDRTVFVFTSDNGYSRGQHRIVSGKSKVYEESIRVPLMVRGPGFPRKVVDSALVANVDLPATIVEMTGAKPDLPLDGMSLQPYGHRRKGRPAPVLLEVFERRGTMRGVRTNRFTYAEYAKKDRRELYDFEVDPHQLRNIAGMNRYADDEARLSRLVAELRDCVGRECR